MLKKYNKELITLVTGLLIPIILGSVFLKRPSDQMTVISSKKTEETEEVYIVALGDSLTEGVGDTTSEGGYVPLLQTRLTEDYSNKIFSTVNHGVAGNTTQQIIKRIKKYEELQNDLKEATIITLTTGGNDLMKVIKSNLFNDLTVETFKNPSIAYQEDLSELYTLIRTYNKDAPIYQLGIYNPFYVSFNEISAMQDIVDNWNQSAKLAVNDEQKIYFVFIKNSYCIPSQNLL